MRVIGDLGSGIGLPDLDWRIEGEAYFFVQDEVTYDGGSALQSSDVSSFFGSPSVLETEVGRNAVLELTKNLNHHRALGFGLDYFD